MNLKRHNPKSNMPAVYIPCWLAQVPHEKLSFGAKLLYGRLAKWCTTLGTCYRSAPKLARELGMGERTIERFIKELKDCKLIGTFHPQAGGKNHFEFYDHEWMHEDLAKELCFESNEPPHNPAAPFAQLCDTPPPTQAVPPANTGGTPPPHLADINIKEIKTKKPNIYSSAHAPVDNSKKILEPEEYLKERELANESFKIFYENYPRKKGENRAREAWYSQECYKIFDVIMEGLFNQIKNDDEFKEGYAPNADKYIFEERWKDKPIQRKKKPNPSNKIDRSDNSWAINQHLDLF